MVSTEGPAGSRLTARGAATRARIVAAAASLVQEHGVAGTSLDDVMAVTATSKSQLYHYFANKDALIREVITIQLGRVIAAQEPDLREVSSWEGLQRWCDHLVAMTRARQGVGGCPLARWSVNSLSDPRLRDTCSRSALPNGNRICPRALWPCATTANWPPRPTRPSSR